MNRSFSPEEIFYLRTFSSPHSPWKWIWVKYNLSFSHCVIRVVTIVTEPARLVHHSPTSLPINPQGGQTKMVQIKGGTNLFSIVLVVISSILMRDVWSSTNWNGDELQMQKCRDAEIMKASNPFSLVFLTSLGYSELTYSKIEHKRHTGMILPKPD